jgi:hypothetical protein
VYYIQKLRAFSLTFLYVRLPVILLGMGSEIVAQDILHTKYDAVTIVLVRSAKHSIPCVKSETILQILRSIMVRLGITD